MELLSLVMEGSIFIAKKITSSLKKITPQSKIITKEEQLDAVKVDRIGNLVK